VTPAGTINTVLTMQFYSPRAIAADAAGNVYIASADNHTVQKLAPNGLTTIVAGVGFASIPSDGPANRSALSSPSGVAVDADGAIYIADSGNHRIRKVTPSGVISTVAGTGERGFRGDGGPAAAASLNFPRGVSVDAAGNLWIADSGNHRVRKINPAGVISTVAGDGTEGELNLPRSAVADSAGNVFISDTGNHRIRLASPQSRLRTVAGAGAPGLGGDGGAALEARLNTPMGLLVDFVGSVWIADSGNGRVRKLSPGGIASPIEQPPAISQVSVFNAASLSAGPLAPGEIVSIFGLGMGPAAGLAARPTSSGFVETLLGETKVLFDGTPAALFYVQETQVNLQVPYTVLGQPSTQLEVYYKGTLKGRAAVAVANAAPALFTVAGGSGQAIVVNQDGTLNSDTTAAPHGSIVTMYATGEGQTLPAGVNGRTATEPFPVPVLPLILKIDGSRADVLFAGAAPGFLGLLQINARVPYGFVRTGIVPVSLQIGTAESQTGVTMAIR